jgi:hypothetical protein
LASNSVTRSNRRDDIELHRRQAELAHLPARKAFERLVALGQQADGAQEPGLRGGVNVFGCHLIAGNGTESYQFQRIPLQLGAIVANAFPSSHNGSGAQILRASSAALPM